MSRAGHASYDTVSRQLAEDVQHLLLRLGIVARVYECVRPYRDRHVTSFVVTVTGNRNLRRFYRHIADRFLNRPKRRLAHALAQHPGARRASRDVVPVEVKTLIDAARTSRNTTWTELATAANLSTRALVSPDAGKRGYRRWVIGRLARYFDSPELARLAESDVYWDRVVSIEPVGIRATYDLEVEDDHNFLANDLVVHNSHASSFALARLRERISQVPPPGGVLCGAAQQPADGLLSRGDDRQGRAAPRPARPPGGRHALGVAHAPVRRRARYGSACAA